jgi:hypothetical protein
MLPAVVTRFGGLDLDSSKFPIAISGMVINGSIGCLGDQTLHNINPSGMVQG